MHATLELFPGGLQAEFMKEGKFFSLNIYISVFEEMGIYLTIVTLLLQRLREFASI